MNDVLSQNQTSALETLQIEIEQLKFLESTIRSQQFELACELLYSCQGKVITMGVGKSGHIARKIAASLASTGTSSFFVHPCEAGHGDAGMISEKDIVLYISNSGEADEFAKLLSYFQTKKIKIIAITNNSSSTLGSNADLTLNLNVKKEACPLNVAPTSSTTNTLVLGDCLVVALINRRNLSSNDFALSHPFGSLGRKLLVTNEKVMIKLEKLPLATKNTTLSDAIGIMSDKGLGCIFIVSALTLDCTTQVELPDCIGIFTDGDLRRLLQTKCDIYNKSIGECMNSSFITTTAENLAYNTLTLLEEKNISVIPVLNNKNKIIGCVHLHSLLNIGLK